MHGSVQDRVSHPGSWLFIDLMDKWWRNFEFAKTISHDITPAIPPLYIYLVFSLRTHKTCTHPPSASFIHNAEDGSERINEGEVPRTQGTLEGKDMRFLNVLMKI